MSLVFRLTSSVEFHIPLHPPHGSKGKTRAKMLMRRPNTLDCRRLGQVATPIRLHKSKFGFADNRSGVHIVHASRGRYLLDVHFRHTSLVSSQSLAKTTAANCALE